MEKSFLFKAQFSPYYNNAVVGGISSGCFFDIMFSTSQLKCSFQNGQALIFFLRKIL